MKNLPDLCAFLGSHLGGSSNSTPPTAPVVREESSTAVEPSIPAPESVNTVPSGGAVTKKPVGPLKKMGKGKKRPASDSSAEMGREGSSEAAAVGTQSDEPPKKKAKAKKKKKNLEENVTEDQTGPEEEPVDPIEGVRTREAVIPEDSSDGARTEEGQDGSPVTPLTRKKKEKRADNRAAPDAFVQSLVIPPRLRLRRVGVVRFEKGGRSISPTTSSLSMTARHCFPACRMNAPS